MGKKLLTPSEIIFGPAIPNASSLGYRCLKVRITLAPNISPECSPATTPTRNDLDAVNEQSHALIAAESLLVNPIQVFDQAFPLTFQELYLKLIPVDI